MSPLLKNPFAFALFAAVVLAGPATAQEQKYRNRDNPNPNDSAEGVYPIPYQMPTKAEIVESLNRVRGFLEVTALTEVIDRRTGQPITDMANPVATATFKMGPKLFGPVGYEMGVVHAGMLHAGRVTGDARFTAFTERHMNFIHQWLPYFRKAETAFKLDRSNPFRAALDPRALDDSGSMAAALIRARLAKVGPDLKPQIDVWTDWVGNKQFRFPDGTLARQRPQAESLWADDAYMSIPALAEMGRMTGEKKWFDDAVKQALQLSKHLFVPGIGLYTHGLHRHNPDAPFFFWGRASGWIVVALCDLLDVLPKDHPGFEPVKAQLRAVLRGVAEYQSGNSGLWHQMIDRSDSYLETSASAMFVYGLARAVNEGWISPTTYGSIALAGWMGVSQKIGKEGEVIGTCVGTTLASDQVYYYNRPTSEYAQHGYGPVLLAGAEVIRLIENPAFEIQYKLRTYHFVPKDGRPTSYREHAEPAPGAVTAVAAPNASSRLVREVGDAYLAVITRESPMRRLKLGLPIERLPDVSLAGEERDAREAQTLLARLTPVNVKELTHEETLSLDVLRRQLRLRVEAPKTFHYRFQVTPYLSPLGAVGQIFAALPLSTVADRERYVARLAEVPALAAQIVTNLEAQAAKGIRVPKPQLDQVDGLLSAFSATGPASPFRPAASRLGSVAEADRAAFLKTVDAAIETKAAPALARLAAAVKGDYRAKAPAAVGMKQYPGGLEAYREFVKFHTTMDVTPEQVHEIGLKNVRRIAAEMAAIRAELGFKGTAVEFKESLRSNPRLFPKAPEEIGERLMSYMTRIEPVVDQFFIRRPKAPYGVKRLDPQLEPGQTFGFYQIPTATEPRGLYNYNGSNLPDRSLLNAGALAYHELVPGHHFQINLSFENPAIPEFRRESFDTAYTEGWGEYAASLAGEMGMYKDPYDRYGRLAMEMFVSVRLVVDTGMNALDWSRDRAIAFMKENAMETDTQIASETLRYSCDMPGQALAYKMGAMRILELRERARAALGPRFDIRRFHDWILGSGSLPMTTLERHVQAFVEASNL